MRAGMKARDLDALIVYSQRRGHIAYLSGYRPNYHTNSAFLCLPRDAEPVLLIKFGFDISRARRLSWVKDIRCGHSEDASCLFAEFADVVREKGLDRSRLGIVASDETIDEMSPALWQTIRQCLPAAHIEPACDLVNHARMTKDPEEVASLRQCTELAERAADALGGALAPGVEDYAASAQAVSAAVAAGAEKCDVILSCGPPDLALPPSHQRFSQGKPVSFELTAAFEGYWIQICRTFCVGAPAPVVKRAFAAARDAYEAAVSLAKDGVRASALANAALGVVDRAGFQGCVPYGLGHGVGLDIPEPCGIDSHSTATVVDGMALIIHVSIWVDDATAFVGGPIIVRRDGAELLDRPQRELTEIG